VKLVLQNTPLPQVELGGVRFEPLDLALGQAKFDLLVNLWDTGSGIQGEALYSTDVFDAGRIAQMFEQFERVLRHALDAPDTRVEDLVGLLEAADEKRRSARRGERRRANLEKLQNLRRTAPGASNLSGENRP